MTVIDKVGRAIKAQLAFDQSTIRKKGSWKSDIASVFEFLGSPIHFGAFFRKLRNGLPCAK